MAESVLLGCLPTRGANGDFRTSEDIEVILQSIYVILNTPIGTRPWQPTFGCNLKLNLFELLDDNTLQAMQSDVMNALTKWEPRIIVNSVVIEQTTDQVVGVSVSFTYKNNKYTKVVNTSIGMNTTIYSIRG